MIKNITLSTAFLYCLSCTTALFATNDGASIYEKMDTSTSTAYEANILKNLQAEGDPREIKNFYHLPSLEVSKQLVENGEKSLSPTKFLKLVMSYRSYHSDQKLQKDSDQKLQKELVEFALKKGADPHSIEHFNSLPSIDISNLLIKNGEKSLDPTKFLGLIISTHHNCDQGELKQKELVEFSIKEGAEPSKIKRQIFARLPLIETSKLLLENKNNPLDPTKFLELVLPSFYGKSQEDLAIQKSTVELAINKGAKLSEVILDHSCQSMPSLELANIMLENSLNPNELLRVAACAGPRTYNVNTGTYEVSDNKLLEQINNLKKIAIAKGASISEAEKPRLATDEEYERNLIKKSIPPSFADIRIMLEDTDSANPNKTLKLVLEVPCKKYNPAKGIYEISDELINQRDSLVKSVLDKGASATLLLKIAVMQMLPRTDRAYEPIPLPKQEKLIEMAMTRGGDFSKIEFDEKIGLPSFELASFALEGIMDPNTFLYLMFADPCKEYNPETELSEISEQKIELRNQLIKLTLEKGGNPHSIRSVSVPPSLEICKLLLKHGLNPNELLELILSSNNTNAKYAAKQKELIAFALQQGANLDQIDDPEIADTIRKNELVIDRHQGLIERQLGLFFDKYPTATANAKDISRRFKTTRGYCHGLSTLWLYSKWAQFVQPEKNHKYNNDWFKNTTKTISTWDGERDLTDKEISDCGKFGTTIDFFQYPVQTTTQPYSWAQAFLTTFDVDGKTLTKQYSIASVFSTPKQVADLLKEIVRDDQLIYVTIRGNPYHANGLFKHGENYYYYDPNHSRNEYKSASVEKIAEIIFNNKDKLGTPRNKLIAGFTVYDFASKSHSYPKQRELLAPIRYTLDKNDLLEGAKIARAIDCKQSQDFFMEQGVTQNEIEIGSYCNKKRNYSA